MITNNVRLLIFLFSVNIIIGLYATSADNYKFNRLLKRRSMENDNEYVWFTRDIPNDSNEEEIKWKHDQKQHILSRPNLLKNRLHLKYPVNENINHRPIQNKEESF